MKVIFCWSVAVLIGIAFIGLFDATPLGACATGFLFGLAGYSAGKIWEAKEDK